MATYVAFLRAINLGAKRKFPKDDIVAATQAAGFEEESRAVYTALTACFPIGSAPLTYVRIHQDTRCGLAAWQRVRFTYRPHYVGNALVDKGKLRIELAVPEAKLITPIAEYDLRVHEWEKQYSLVLEDDERQLSLLKLMPLEERQGRLREIVVQGMQEGKTYAAMKAAVLSDVLQRKAGSGTDRKSVV